MKRISIGTGVIITGILLGYVFLMPYDFSISFKVKAVPGVINQSIKLWSRSLDDAAIINQNRLTNLVQQIEIDDTRVQCKWNIKEINDSVSAVKVYIKDLSPNINKKLSMIFGDTNIERKLKSLVTDFYHDLNGHIKSFRVHSLSLSELPTTYCAYVPIKGLQTEKARGMMRNYSLLSTILVENDVQLNGKPFVEITYWDMKNDSIHYNFCYPIIKNDLLPKHDRLRYKQFARTKSIKAIYNGNYITSDRAWYVLINYANKNNIEVEKNPIEVFYSNPNFGGDELEWIAEIYMPLKDD